VVGAGQSRMTWIFVGSTCTSCSSTMYPRYWTLFMLKEHFFQICIYLVLPQSVQNLLNVLQVFLPILVEDEDVIQINYNKMIGEMLQDIVHHPHESFWVIFQSKGHDQPFKNTFFGFEGSLPYIGLLNWDLVVVGL
jgi:hypothetical protein